MHRRSVVSGASRAFLGNHIIGTGLSPLQLFVKGPGCCWLAFHTLPGWRFSVLGINYGTLDYRIPVFLRASRPIWGNYVIATGNKDAMNRRPVILDTSRPHLTLAYGIWGIKMLLLRD